MKKFLRLLGVFPGFRTHVSLGSAACSVSWGCWGCLVCMMLLGISCRRSGDVGSSGEGRIRICVTPFLGVDSVGASRVGAEGAAGLPEVADFKLCIVTPAGDTVRRWESVTEMPSELFFEKGSFKLVAEYTGGVTLPNRGTPHYYGETRFVVDPTVDTVQVVRVEPSTAAVKLDVVFDESFVREYQAYSVDVKTIGDEFVTFAGGDLGLGSSLGSGSSLSSAYLAPGWIKFRFRLTPFGSTESVVYTAQDVVQGKAREHHTVVLKVKITQGKPVFSLVTDDSTNDIPINIDDIPNWTLPKAAPSVVPKGFIAGSSITTAEGQGQVASVAVRAVGGLRSLVIRTSGGGFMAGEFPSEVDLLTASDVVLDQLRAVGLVWNQTAVYTGSRDVVYIDFRDVIKRMYTTDIYASTQTFMFVVEDNYEQVNDACRFNVVVGVPDFELTDPREGGVYARKAYFDMTYSNEVGNLPFVEYRQSGTEPWVRSSEVVSPVVSRGVSRDVSEGGAGVSQNVVRHCIKGLMPATEYEFRGGVTSLGSAVGHVSPLVYRFVSESELQVPNSGMEEWDSYKAVDAMWPAYDIPFFEVNAKGGSKWWATNNDRTTSYRATSFCYGYNSFPAVSMTRDVHSGKFAAEVRTTSASDIAALNAVNTSQTHSQVPGMLYSGTFAYQSPNDVIHEGRAFGARPSKVKFWYKFEDYNSELWEARVEVRNGSTVLGRGVLTGSAAAGSYTEGVVDVVYDVTMLRATDIVISFRSSNVNYPTDRPGVRKVTRDIVIPYDEEYGKGWGVFVGTVLKVDDVTLVYE